MATIKYNNVGIRAISACVPKNISSNYDLKYLIGEEEVEKTINSIGIKEKRYVDDNTCASDLCLKAAEQLFADNDIDRNSIDVLLFISQLSDYKIPATSTILQHKLGLPNTTAAIDLSLGCSGYVYALSTAMAYASLEGVNRVLLLDGETFSKIVNPKDKVDAPLYGDAGTATIVEKMEGESALFTLYSDGKGENAVKIKAGGARFKTTAENLIPHMDNEGNIFSDNEVYMDGMDVFNFVLREVPKSIKNMIKLLDMPISDVDYLLLHQANKFMTDFIAKRIKFPLEKVPYCLQKYGNTSSASIPLTISSELYNKESVDNIIMSGFGAGLSWATAFMSLKNCNISKVVEF